MQSIFYKQNIRSFIKQKWKVLLLIFVLICIIGSVLILWLAPNGVLDKTNSEFVINEAITNDY